MHKIFVLLTLLAILPLTAHSQSLFASPPPATFTKELSGTINGALKIRMQLTRQGDELSGSYAYANRKKSIAVQGTINAQGYFQMDESGAKDTITGHFVGVFTNDGALIGFWSKEFSGSPKMPFMLAETGKTASPHKWEVVTARVRNDAGSAQILLLDDTVLEFTYENVGAKAHTCTLTSDRSETRVQWQSTANTTTIHFPKEYFNGQGNAATVTLQKNGLEYRITFEGDLQFFCGMRARLPRKVRLRNAGGGWIGER